MICGADGSLDERALVECKRLGKCKIWHCHSNNDFIMKNNIN